MQYAGVSVKFQEQCSLLLTLLSLQPHTVLVDTGTPRQRARAQTLVDITRIGREHLVTQGPAGLSLRAVARDLGLVSSAVYRYVASRDDLLTLLIVDAYEELGDAVDRALRAASGEPASERFLVLANAARFWALAEPARYGLIYGGPVPGYAAPGAQTTRPGTRVVVALLGIVASAKQHPEAPSTTQRVPRALRADFKRIRDTLGVELPDPTLGVAVLAWTALFGAVSFEVFGQYGPDTFTDPSLLFDFQMGQIASLLFPAS